MAKTSKDPKDKRRHVRAALRLPARIGTDARMQDGTVLDISRGGLRVQTHGSFAAGSTVRVHVQFPSSTILVRARVVREGEGEAPLGLMIIQGGSTLMRAYDRWLKEFGEEVEEAESPAAPGAPPARAAPPCVAPEPAGPVKRHLETTRGNSFDVLIVRESGSWRLTIHQNPRNPNTLTPLLEERFKTFASADEALREFLKLR